MAFKIGGSKNKTISEINVTPFVDVMLVLLVIFMITAPLMLNGIELNLPKTKEVNKINLNTQQVILSMTRTGEFFVGKTKYLYDELIGEVQNQLKETKTNTLYLRADYGIKYGNVARVMSNLKRGGVNQIALITEVDEE